MSLRKYIPVLLLITLAASSALAQARWGDWQNKPDNQRRQEQRAAQNQRPHAGDWLKQHKGLPFSEQQKALESDPNFRNLTPQWQEQLRERLQKFNRLTPQQQDTQIRRMESFNRLSPQEQQRARDLYSRFKAIPEDRRQVMMRAFRNLRELPPDQQQRVLNSPQIRSNFSDSEREMLRGLTELNVGPGMRHQDPGR